MGGDGDDSFERLNIAREASLVVGAVGQSALPAGERLTRLRKFYLLSTVILGEKM